MLAAIREMRKGAEGVLADQTRVAAKKNHAAGVALPLNQQQANRRGAVAGAYAVRQRGCRCHYAVPLIRAAP
jgi:hypothetical protein